MRTAIASEASKSAPPTAVTLATVIAGVSLNEWVAIATLIYVLMQAGYLGWKWYKEYRAGK